MKKHKTGLMMTGLMISIAFMLAFFFLLTNDYASATIL